MRTFICLLASMLLSACIPHCPGTNLKQSSDQRVLAAFSYIESRSGSVGEVRICEHSPTYNLSAFTYKQNDLYVISFPSDMDEYLSDEELRAVMGHEVGHIKLGHPKGEGTGDGIKIELDADRLGATYTSADALERALAKVAIHFIHAGQSNINDERARFDTRLRGLTHMSQSKVPQ